MILRPSSVSLVTAALTLWAVVPCARAQEQTELFSGRAVSNLLNPTATVSCFADKATVTGYYTGPEKTTLTAHPLKSQPTGGSYRVSIRGETADVLDGATNQDAVYQVYRKNAAGVILLRGKGVGVEVITIDPQTGSFVLTDAGVGPVWNRTNVWVGRCHE